MRRRKFFRKREHLQHRRNNGHLINPLPEMRRDTLLVREDSQVEMPEVLVYPTCLKTNKHHRHAKSRGGKDTVKGRNGKRYENIAIVPIQAHEAFNTIFGSRPTASQVCATLNKYWIDPRQTIRFYIVETP